jgi:hypothetical protein
MLERSFYQFQHYSTIPALYESKQQRLWLDFYLK